MAPRHSTARYHKTRHDHASETAEDYVEAIHDLVEEEGYCRVTTLATRLGVSHVTVSRTVARLCNEGLATTAPYQPISLTERGRELAEWSRRRHQLVQSFLLRIGVPESDAGKDAEGIEHHCSPATLKAMKRFLKEHR